MRFPCGTQALDYSRPTYNALMDTINLAPDTALSGAPLLYVLKKFRPCHLTELYVTKRVFAYSLTIIVGACLICGSLKAR
jgi:hypothetical protein